MPYHWGKTDWIRNFWRNLKPYEEPYSLRQVFYDHLPEIERFVPEANKIESGQGWASYFYTDLCKILSDLVLAGELSYRKLNLKEGGGRDNYIWQEYVYVEERPPLEECYVEYPLEVWVENNSTFGSLEPSHETKIKPIHEEPYKINVLSMRGFQSTQRIEEAYLDREEDIEVVLCLADFDPSGVWMPIDLQKRFERIGMSVKVEHIGIFPSQIPDERKTTTLIHYKKRDPRSKAFMRMYGSDQLAYEMQALKPSELRGLVRNKILETVTKSGWKKRESAT